MKKKTVAIIHYNTPELTEAAILSLRKHGGTDYQVFVFDNSDKRPWKKRMKGVKRVDNTQGKYINFDEELAKYPEKDEKYGCAPGCWFGSDKHMMTVQKLWELIPDGFVLLDSDVLVKKSIDWMFREDECAIGYISNTSGPRGIPRYAPMLLWINVPMCVAGGARFFDPDRAWALHKGLDDPRNFWDTGAAFLDDIKRLKPQCHGKWIAREVFFEHIMHFGSGSWVNNDIKRQLDWIQKNQKYWVKVNNSDAKIFICSHTDFEPVVNDEVYETIDSRKLPQPKNAPDLYYSELWQMKKVSERKKLPKYIGFCHYRRYFGFMDDVPNIGKIIEAHGAITTKKADLSMSMRNQYATWGNPGDLDICSQIINEKYPDLAPSWNNLLDSHYMRLGTLSIMRTEDWKEMLAVMWDVAQEYLTRIGGDIVKHVKENSEAYHIGEQPFTTFTHELRVGGQFAERINSAWIDWKFPNAYEVPLNITRNKIEIPFEESKPHRKK